MKEKRCAPAAMFVTLALLGALLFGALCGCGAKLDDATVEQAFYDHFGQTDEATGFAYSFAANGKAKIDGKTYYLVLRSEVHTVLQSQISPHFFCV